MCTPLAPTRNKIIYKTACSDDLGPENLLKPGFPQKVLAWQLGVGLRTWSSMKSWTQTQAGPHVSKPQVAKADATKFTSEWVWRVHLVAHKHWDFSTASREESERFMSLPWNTTGIDFLQRKLKLAENPRQNARQNVWRKSGKMSKKPRQNARQNAGRMSRQKCAEKCKIPLIFLPAQSAPSAFWAQFDLQHFFSAAFNFVEVALVKCWHSFRRRLALQTRFLSVAF